MRFRYDTQHLTPQQRAIIDQRDRSDRIRAEEAKRKENESCNIVEVGSEGGEMMSNEFKNHVNNTLLAFGNFIVENEKDKEYYADCLEVHDYDKLDMSYLINGAKILEEKKYMLHSFKIREGKEMRCYQITDAGWKLFNELKYGK